MLTIIAILTVAAPIIAARLGGRLCASNDE
jgi:hypothetical protein